MTYTPKVGDRVTVAGVKNEHQVYVVTGLRDDGDVMLGFEMPGPDLLMQVDVSRVRPAVKLGREYDPALLERAARKRARSLQRRTEEYAACCCAYPITTFRNVHGHDSKCPAYALLDRWRAEDAAAREDL